MEINGQIFNFSLNYLLCFWMFISLWNILNNIENAWIIFISYVTVHFNVKYKHCLTFLARSIWQKCIGKQAYLFGSIASFLCQNIYFYYLCLLLLNKIHNTQYFHNYISPKSLRWQKTTHHPENNTTNLSNCIAHLL